MYIALVTIIFVINHDAIIRADKTTDINFLQDFLDVEFHHVQVTAFLCWTKNESLMLSQKLFEINVRLNIQNAVQESLEHFETYPDLLYILDGDCDISSDILFLANLQKLFGSPYKWLLLSRNFTFYKNTHNLDELDILLDSAFYVGEKISAEKYFLREIFKHNRTGLLQNQFIDQWTSENGFEDHIVPSILSRSRHNIMGTKIVGAGVVVVNNTFKHLNDYREKQYDSITKLNFILVNIMIEYLNGTKGFEYYDSWGYKKPTEKFYTGMIGAMQTGDADIGCTSMFVNTERTQVVDYMSWTTPTGIQFVYRQPPLSYVSNLFTLPFSQTVWISTFGLLCVSVLVIYLITLWEKSNVKKDPEDDSLPQIVMLTVGAVCQQGSVYEPKSSTGRMIMWLVFVALLFIYTSYSAYIVVLLQSTSNEIETLEDLLNSEMSIGLSTAPYNFFYFQNATEPTRKAIYEKKILPKGEKAYMSLEEGIKKVREGYFAFHHETPPMYTVIGDTFYESEKCALQNLQYIEASQFWMPCRKKSSFKEVFKVCLRKMAEVGIQSRESNRLFNQMPKCLGGESNFVSVGLVEAGPAFAFLGASFGVAVFLFVLEQIVHKATCYKRNKFKKNGR